MSAAEVSVLVLGVVLAMVVAAGVGGGAAWLARADGATWPTALRRAGIAFAGTLTLLCVSASCIADLLHHR